jgi:predicted transcriptional regulator
MADNLTELTADIVSAYVAHNSVAAADLPALIKSTFAALTGVGEPAVVKPEAAPKPTATQIRKSITPDKLISFIDGKGYSLLKRHISTHGLTPAAYREQFGLPSQYPIVAPAYAARRSELALKAGLGRKAAPEPVGAPVEAVTAPVAGKVAAKPATAPRASKGAAAVGDKAGPGATVAKAKVGRPKKAIDPATDEFT